MSEKGDRKPLILIAGLRRTGTTVVSEALTKIPYSFVFRELSLGRGFFNVKPNDVALFRKHGIDLAKYQDQASSVGRMLLRRSIVGRAHMIRVFHDEVLPQLYEVVEQVGIKEIHHEGWERLYTRFPDARVILTSRDPRDIYISLYHRRQQKSDRWKGSYTPQLVAAELRADFAMQRAIAREFDTFKLRYEDLCRDESMIGKIKAFVDSPIPDVGEIGIFNAGNPERKAEYELHGTQISDKRVSRWKYEQNPILTRDSAKLFELMEDYCTFWGYEVEGLQPKQESKPEQEEKS